MLAFIQKYFYPLLLTITALLGVALANLAAVTLGIYLRPESGLETRLAEVEVAPHKNPSLKDFEIIRQRNIFNSAAAPSEETEALQEIRPEAAPVRANRNLRLVGTVTAGKDSLALLVIDRGEIERFRLGEELSGGGVIDQISRSRIVVRNRDGSLEVVPLYEEDGQPAAAASPPQRTRSAANASAGGVQPIGENRYLIDRQAAEAARNNIPQLLRQARLEPNIVSGATKGFEIKMIRPNSLLTQLGLRKGDVLVEINGLELDSPEKGLQIFQQLREAKNIVVGLTRDGRPMSFTYEVN